MYFLFYPGPSLCTRVINGIGVFFYSLGSFLYLFLLLLFCVTYSYFQPVSSYYYNMHCSTLRVSSICINFVHFLCFSLVLIEVPVLSVDIQRLVTCAI